MSPYFNFESNASRKPSPRRFNANTIKQMIIAGITSLCGYDCKPARASFAKLPNEVIGIETPSPRKLK